MKFRLTTFSIAILIATASFAQIPNYVPTTGLVGWWPFNGNANDESGNGNNGTVNGAMLSSDRFGNVNKAYNFDGVDDFIEIADNNIFHFGTNSSFSVSFWLKYNSNMNLNSIVSKALPSNPSDGYQIMLINNKSRFDFMSSGASNIDFQGVNDLNDNNWHFVVFTANRISNEMSFYVDGLLDNSMFNSQLSVGNLSNQSNLLFGAERGLGCCMYNGMIDDVGIWNRVLSQQEITDLYNGCQLSINTQPTNQTINVNNNAQFVVSSSDTNATYQWQTDLGFGFQHVSNLGQYSGANTNTFVVSNVTISNNNQQFRCIVNPGSCADTSDIAVLTVNNNVGITESSPNNLISIFPNPTNDIFSIIGLDQLENVTGMELKDLNGKSVKVLNLKATQFKITDLKSGVYFLTISAGEIQEVIKLIKE
jgi:hypothetical protein